MLTALAVLGGFGLDLLLADPAWMPHPVVLMGKIIARLEQLLRRIFPDTPAGQRTAGRVLAAVLPLGTWAVTAAVCALAYHIHPALGFGVELLWCWQTLALQGLADESSRVYPPLKAGDLPAARRQVSRIVGRDTAALSSEGVAKAAVETVAENFSDGVLAPLFYLLIGGAPLGLAYKAVNTMDSMVGYKNQRYLYFGRAAAHLDDAANWIPARLAALVWIAASALAGFDAKNAFRIWRRDRRCHASPNSAQTESACAGALGVQLAGPAWYFGEYYDKPTIGDPGRPVEPEDILRADRILYLAGFLALGLGLALRLGVWFGLRWWL